jgi:transposase
MNRRFELTDQEWERLAPLLPAMTPRRGGAGGITARSSTVSCSGVPRRDVPDRYGPWETLYKRFARWQTDGTWARIQASLHTQADGAGELDWEAQIDSSVVRAHQHAAGARKGAHLDPGKPPASAGTVTGWANHQGAHRLRRLGPQPGHPVDPWSGR